MELLFERGRPESPRGHAIVYFRDRWDPESILATYLVVGPIPMDLAKYVPPLFAGQLATAMAAGPQAFPLPPVPERLEGLKEVYRLADARDDDVLFGGDVDPRDVQRLVFRVAELAQRYAELYAKFIEALPREEAQEELSLDVDELLYQVLSDADKVEKLARLTGTLRYAVEGGDRDLEEDTVRQMERIARHLPERYRAHELIDAARTPGQRGQRLSELYIERCYRLSREEYHELPRLEQQIAEIRSQM